MNSYRARSWRGSRARSRCTGWMLPFASAGSATADPPRTPAPDGRRQRPTLKSLLGGRWRVGRIDRAACDAEPTSRLIPSQTASLSVTCLKAKSCTSRQRPRECQRAHCSTEPTPAPEAGARRAPLTGDRGTTHKPSDPPSQHPASSLHPSDQGRASRGTICLVAVGSHAAVIAEYHEDIYSIFHGFSLLTTAQTGR